jgi:hypothetical protein
MKERTGKDAVILVKIEDEPRTHRHLVKVHVQYELEYVEKGA